MLNQSINQSTVDRKGQLFCVSRQGLGRSRLSRVLRRQETVTQRAKVNPMWRVCHMYTTAHCFFLDLFILQQNAIDISDDMRITLGT